MCRLKVPEKAPMTRVRCLGEGLTVTSLLRVQCLWVEEGSLLEGELGQVNELSLSMRPSLSLELLTLTVSSLSYLLILTPFVKYICGNV